MGHGGACLMDIRLEEMPYQFGGKEYKLRCNMNVLADVQEAYDGDFGKALDTKSALKSVLEFLAAMMNDYADEMGWPERFTAKGLGRKLRRDQIPGEEIMGLVVRSIIPPTDEVQESGN